MLKILTKSFLWMIPIIEIEMLRKEEKLFSIVRPCSPNKCYYSRNMKNFQNPFTNLWKHTETHGTIHVLIILVIATIALRPRCPCTLPLRMDWWERSYTLRTRSGSEGLSTSQKRSSTLLKDTASMTTFLRKMPKLKLCKKITSPHL